MAINKNSQGGYKYKMGINFYRLTANTDYTLCLELLNTDYKLWHKSQISVDEGTSTGLTIGNVSISKLSHRYSNTKGQSQFMYCHRIIVNFRKLSSGNKFFLHIVNSIPQDVEGDRGAGARENRGREGDGRREKKGREAGSL